MPSDLTLLLSPFFREIYDYQVLMEVETAELGAAEKSLEQIKKNLYVQTCDDSTLKGYEQLLGIVRENRASLEHRRRMALSRMNQQLPYSLPKLKEILDAALGRQWYELDIQYSAYELELDVIDQPYQVLKNIQAMVEEIIPAHLLYIFAGLYPTEIPMETSAAACLELASDFYARYNREFLYLDGSWLLDGAYFLNGYKEIERLDLYPARLRVQEILQVSVEVGGRQQLISIVAGRPEVQTEISFWSAVPVSVVVAREDANADLAVCENAWTTAGNGSRLRMSQQTDAGPEMLSGLTVEKDLWYLDGSYLLDGTKLLDAQIFKYDI